MECECVRLVDSDQSRVVEAAPLSCDGREGREGWRDEGWRERHAADWKETSPGLLHIDRCVITDCGRERMSRGCICWSCISQSWSCTERWAIECGDRAA